MSLRDESVPAHVPPDARLRRSARRATLARIFGFSEGVALADDAVKVAPHAYKVVFENERTRVLEVSLKPGESTAMHSHPAYVIYVQAGGKVRNYAADGKTTEAELKTGEVLYREPLTHAAENIGNTTMHLILVELKTPAPR